MARLSPLSLLSRSPAASTRVAAGGESGCGSPEQAIDTGALNAAVDLLPLAVAVVAHHDGAFHILACNRAYRQAGLGIDPATSLMLGDLGHDLIAFLDSDGLREEREWQVGDDVDRRHFQVTFARRAAAGVRRAMVTLVDRTAERRTEHNLRREMMTDSLTGLANRAGFSDRLETLMADPQQRDRHAVLVLDLDRFSRVNACLGSMAGDELLITVARRLKGALRAHDVLARTGGDEFGILLTLEEGPSDADHVAKRIRGALAMPFRLSEFEIRVSCSIGIAFGATGVEDAEELIRHAQFAVKRSKVSGDAEAYQQQSFEIARAQFGMETALRRAIEDGSMRLSYQPICDLATGRIVSFEALARWTDENGHAQPPSQFIPVAEESGLIVPLGRWAIEEAARTLAAWDEAAGGDCGVKLAVNLSAIQLQRDSIAPIVERALGRHGLEGSRFTLELTESALVTDPDRIAGVMHALKGLGTTLAMDDFGTGYSNLAYLQKLPIDILKIDRSFVTGMLADRDKIAIVRAILSLAQALGMKTTAEGVESTELGQTLAALGCTYGQGFVYARPLEAADAYAMLVNRSH